MTSTASSEFMRCAHAVWPNYMAKVNDIDIEYFEGITRDSEELPAELDMTLRTQILAKMKKYAQQLLRESDMASVVRNMVATVSDEKERTEALNKFKSEVNSLASVETQTNGAASYTMQDLARLYDDAKTRTLWERITNTNKKDVIEFHHALLEKTYEDCKDMFWGVVQDYALQLTKECIS